MQEPSYVWSPAGFWVRAAALFIDSVILNFILGVMANEYAEGHSFSFSGFYLLVWGTYGALCNVWMQGSIGKKLLGLKIVDQYEGKKVGFWIIFFRDSVGRLLSTLPLFMGYIWAAFNKDSKTLHDHIFATRVVRKTPVAVYGEDASDENAENP